VIDQTISHYKILHKLGEGGMGVVYKAHDTKLDRTVALKFLPPMITSSDETRERFIREAKTAAALNHPNICTIHAVDDYDGTQFIVMEYIDGITLRQRSEIGGRRSEVRGQRSEVRSQRPGSHNLETVLNYALQIAEALAEAHEKGIVHRDIKPENIMVDSKDRIKVMDFGLAKLKGSGNLTRSGTTVGTAKYMSPEQIQGEAIDARADIWSFGIVLYELITGHLPFQGEYESALMYQIINETPPSVRDYRPDVPDGLESILLRMLEKVPADRYDSCTSVIEALRTVVRGEQPPPEPVAKKPEREESSLSVAVIDFQNITGHDDDEWLSGGIAETVTVDLAKISLLRVVSRERVQKILAQYEDSNFSDRRIIDVGQQLKVGWIVWGAYQKMGNRIRITAHFTDVRTGNLIKSTKVDGSMDDIFDLQDTIIINLKDSLNLKVPTEEINKIRLPQTAKVTAYEYYAKGRQCFYQFSPGKLEEARNYFTEAVAIDPKYALAYSGLGTTYIFHYIANTDPASLETGITYLKKSLELDASLAEPHLWLAYAYSRQHKYDEGIEHGNRAIELEHDNYFAHYFIAVNTLALAGVEYRTDYYNEGLKHLKRSRDIEPMYQWNYVFIAWIHMLYGRYESARGYLKTAIDIDRTERFKGPRCIGMYPALGYAEYHLGNDNRALQAFEVSLSTIQNLDHVYKIPMLALTYCGLGYLGLTRQRYGESLEHFQRAINLIEDNPRALGVGAYMVHAKCGMAILFHTMGMKNEADLEFQNAVSLFETKEKYNFSYIWLGSDAEIVYDLSRYYAVTNQVDKAIRMLQRARDYGFRNVFLLERDVIFRSMHRSPKYADFVKNCKSLPVLEELKEKQRK
jgi:eukaryotic-like serine/threonine-protein kinase